MELKLAAYNSKSIDIQRKKSGYLPNGQDNLFPNYLNGLFNNSPTHTAIIKDLVRYIIGKGIFSDNIEDEQKIKAFLNQEFLEKLEKYAEIHSQICVLVIRDNVFDIQRLKVINPAQIRVAECNIIGEPKLFEFRKTWDRNVQGYKSDRVYIPLYDKSCQESLLYWYDSGTYDVPYGRPSYISGLNAIENESALYLGDNHGAQNGMTPSAIITLPDSGSEDENDKSRDKIVKNLSGPAQRGKTAVIYTKSGNESNAPTVTLLNDNSIQSKEINYKVVERGILKAWQIPSDLLIAGIDQKSGGFDSLEKEIQFHLNTLRSKIIDPAQKRLLNILKPIINDLEIKGKISFQDLVDRNIEVQEEVKDNLKESSNENLKNLTGRQLQGIQRLVRKYKKGELTKQVVTQTLRSGFGLNEEEVEAWINEEELQLKKTLTLENIIEESESIETLINNGWVIEKIENAESDAEKEKNLISQINLASTGTARPNSKSKQDGSTEKLQYLIRYEYAGNPNPQREFCQKMMKAKKIYRYEDIVNMSFSGVNSGFGVNGARNYDIFSYKGGPNCKHYWKRITFVKSVDSRGKIDAKSGVARDNALTETQADNKGIMPKNTAKTKDVISQTKPFDMPNRGYKLSAIDKIKSILWKKI